MLDIIFEYSTIRQDYFSSYFIGAYYYSIQKNWPICAGHKSIYTFCMFGWWWLAQWILSLYAFGSQQIFTFKKKTSFETGSIRFYDNKTWENVSIESTQRNLIFEVWTNCCCCFWIQSISIELNCNIQLCCINRTMRPATT